MDSAAPPSPRSLPPRVVLTGFMGTGKSTIGRLLARRLGYRFVDTDELIEAEHGPIPHIFSDHGEQGFRRLEREAAARVASLDGCVIATGGRFMLDPANAAVLEPGSAVFCLTASVDTILQRVQADAGRVERPLLADGEARGRVIALLAERATGYARFTPIPTDGRQPEEVADDIELRVSRLGAGPGDRSDQPGRPT